MVFNKTGVYQFLFDTLKAGVQEVDMRTIPVAQRANFINNYYNDNRLLSESPFSGFRPPDGCRKNGAHPFDPARWPVSI
jgi:hypothetical protein